jgi:hypothetical protein
MICQHHIHIQSSCIRNFDFSRPGHDAQDHCFLLNHIYTQKPQQCSTTWPHSYDHCPHQCQCCRTAIYDASATASVAATAPAAATASAAGTDAAAATANASVFANIATKASAAANANAATTANAASVPLPLPTLQTMQAITQTQQPRPPLLSPLP